ncbi:MAG: aminopeptidase P family protein, partial [Acholeplasmataceae bacterium]
MNYSARRENHLKGLPKRSLSLFFSGRAPKKTVDRNYPFFTDRNFLYLTGLESEDAALLLVKGDSRTGAYLFVEERDAFRTLWDGPVMSFDEIAVASGIPRENIYRKEELKEHLNRLLSTSRRAVFGPLDRVYFDLEHSEVDQLGSIESAFAHYVQDRYPFLEIARSTYQLAEARMVKDGDEIERTKEAIAITAEALRSAARSLKDDRYEYEAEAEFNHVLDLKQLEPAFETIVAAGSRATTLHYSDNDQPMREGDLVLFDLGVRYRNYNSDISRVFPVAKSFTERQKAIYEVVLEANKRTIEWLRPGVTFREFNDYGRAILIEGAKRLKLIESDEEIRRYYYHSLGHYLGLNVHDVANHDLVIPEGAIITVEPGLYIAEEKIGIRIEDDVLVTKD